MGNMEVAAFAFHLCLSYIFYKIADFIYRLPKIGNISERHVFITGCDTGFGHEIAVHLDKKYKCHVYAGCLTEKGEIELRKKCSARLKTVHIDVTDSESITVAYNEIKGQIPHDKGLWGLINNAGIADTFGPIEMFQKKDYQKTLDVNLLGLVDTTTTFLPLIRKAKGRIVNTASILGRVAGNAPYCASKYGVEAFSDCLRRQLRHFGVRVQIIEPGYFKTNLADSNRIVGLFTKAWIQTPQEIKDVYGGEKFLQDTTAYARKFFDSPWISEDIYLVVNAYEHALLARFPRARYLVGNDAKYYYIPIQFLPEWIGDRLLP